MNFTEEDIQFITKSVVIPSLEESFKLITTMQENQFEMLMKSNTLIVDSLSQKINKLKIENLRNMSFIKAVLFTNNLSNETCYKTYIEEWDRLNKTLIDEFCSPIKGLTKSDDDSKTPVSQDPSQCDHEKIYENYILTSNPPQYPWKCKKCGETGVDRDTTSNLLR